MGQRVEQFRRVELRTHHHLGAGVQRSQQHRAQAEDMRHRHEGIAAVLGAQRARLGGNAREMGQRVMAHHHALGRTGGARSEDQRRHFALQRAGLDLRLLAHGAVLHARQGRVLGGKPPGMGGRAVRA
ncbi:hypothetical protein D3C78_1409970 [compost metagenome]